MPIKDYTTKVDVYQTVGTIGEKTLYQMYREKQLLLTGGE